MAEDTNNTFEQTRVRNSILAVNLGLVANIILAGLKTVIGIVGNSPALLADGVNSISDVAYYSVVSVFMRLSHKPADEEHPYGHSQLESIAALVVGSFVITTAIAIFWEAVNNVYLLWIGQGDFRGAHQAALWMAVATIITKVGLTTVSQRIGTRYKSAVVLALANDHRNDVITSSAAAVGIFLGRAGYPWVDPLAGALVALVILRTGITIMRQSASELMDNVPGKSLAQQITTLVSPIAGVKQIEEIRAHRFGPYLVANLTIGIDGSISVEEGDHIATQVERTLIDHVEFMKRVHVHYHPEGNSTTS